MKQNQAAAMPQIRCSDGGYCAEGPGFYVWDQSRREVERAAQELGAGHLPSVPTQRLLVVEGVTAELAERETG